MVEQRVWCGICGTYVYEGDVLPCASEAGIHEPCGALGAWSEVVPARNVTVKDDEAVQAELDLEPDYDRDALMGFIAQQEAEAAHEYAHDRQVIQNFKDQAQGKALDVQVGGNHYNKLKIQPFEYSLENNLGPAEHTAIKYLTRWKDKGGVKDLDKAIHTIQILKDWAVNNGFS